MSCENPLKMDCEKMNKIPSMDDFLETKRIEDLQNEVEYHVSRMRLSNTKFGRKIVAEIANEFKIYLPPRVSDVFIEDQAELESYQIQPLLLDVCS